MNLNRVVITGLGAVTPIGNDVKTTWQSLIDGRSGAAPITHFDATLFKTRFACEVKDFDAETLLDKKEARKLDPFVQYAIFAAQEAMDDAGFDMQAEDKDRMGCIWASGMGGLRSFQECVEDYINDNRTPHFSPFTVTRIITDIAAGHLSIRFGIKGPSYATTSACASSAHAIADAFNLIRMGKADVMITGGSEAAVEYTGVGGFNAMHALSTRNDTPETASRPFSKSRDGFVLGEGAAALILENYEHAVKRGAKIYAELVGAGINSDAYHITAPDPDGNGAKQVMKLALDDAGLSINDIDYINAHGTSTPLGDLAEVKGIAALFGEHAKDMNISSTKSMTGHLLGATGALEALATVLTIHNSIIPPTINHADDDVDEQIPDYLNLTFNHAQQKTVNCALTNAFGFGGHNTCLIFKKI